MNIQTSNKNINFDWIIMLQRNSSLKIIIWRIQIVEELWNDKKNLHILGPYKYFIFLHIYRTEPCCFEAIRRCSEVGPFKWTVNVSVINIHFVSDNLHNTKGFKLTWKVHVKQNWYKDHFEIQSSGDTLHDLCIYQKIVLIMFHS